MSDIVDSFGIKLWNGMYYCKVVFPDGYKQELKSKDDLTYSQWQGLIKDAWEAHQEPPIKPPSPKECQCPNCMQNFVCPNKKTVQEIL